MIVIKVIALFFLCYGLWASYRAPSDNPNLSTFYIMTVVSFMVLFGTYIKNFLIKQLSDWNTERKSHKAFIKSVAQEAHKIKVIGEANAHVKAKELEAETKALIARVKAGDELQGQLVSKFHELTAMGDSTYDYLKKEIQSMPAMKNTNFNL
jgi:hypothetical protein